MAGKKSQDSPKVPKTATYIGTADVRIITGEDLWRGQGIRYDGPALVFHAGNRFSLPVEELPSEVVDHLNDVEPDIIVEDGIPERLLPHIRTKVAATSPSGRVVGVQALRGREDFVPAHAQSITEGEPPVISPEVTAALATPPTEGEAAEATVGGGNTNPVTTTGGSTATSSR